ncbi:T7SS effector LXG polymorphic toxin [Clostridium felsineum]|uniref:T7SS effector LXG polymorphic toxin n=1 Tax=Clostridium felsineum TaxID=36839 RepID=UPI002033586C|nr:T7SS effector LXG polymorphic toxin [Clostridium felsineum]URZ02608.1 hypothetical protein CLAUR_026200 [Clostridium felsineum]
MSNTELYYDALTDLSVRIAAGIKNRTQPLDELNQAMTQLSQTDAIKGNAANAMKAYINEVHMTLIQTLELLLNNYEMTLGKYVKGYLEVDSSESFKLVKEDFDAHVRNLSSHRSDFTSIGDKLKAISDEAEDILSLSGAGSKRLFNVVSEMDSMKKTVSNLDDSWNKYENGYREFDQVQDLIAQTKALLKSTLSVPRGYSYSPGSFSKLISKNFVNAFEANVKYAQNKDNQKEFKKDWDRICKDYTTDQKRMTEEKQKEANQHKGAWEVVFGVGAVVIGAAAIILTAGAATPLVAVAWTAGLSAGAYGVSNVFEGSQIMVTGADKAFNPLRDTIFQGNQGAYDTFGNVAVFVAGSVIPVGAALKTGQALPRAVIAGVGRTTVTTAVGVGTNFVVAPIATSLAKSAGIDTVWANDIGTGTGFATSIFTAGKVYKGSGNWAKSEEKVNAELSRIDYLRNKYGKFSSDELNNYINLKQEIKDYIGVNSKKLIKSNTNMVSKVWDTSKQEVRDSYEGFSGKKNMNKFLDSLQSPKDPMYLHQDIIEGIRELAEKKGIEINEEALMHANKGYLTNTDREYLMTILKDISQRPWNVLNCGDVRAVNEALINGSDKSNLLGASYNISKQQFEKRCPNCQVTTKGVKWYIK